jgi:hypothetical protein
MKPNLRSHKYHRSFIAIRSVRILGGTPAILRFSSLSSVPAVKLRDSRARVPCNDTCAEDNFCVWAERRSPYFLTADKHFCSLLAAGFCFGVVRNGLTPLFCFLFTCPPLPRFVPSHSSRALPALDNDRFVPILTDLPAISRPSFNAIYPRH